MAEGSNKTPSREDSGSGIAGAIVRNLVTLALIGFSVMCVYNVFGVAEEVEALAKETACQGQPLPCTAQYTRAARTPFSHSYSMYTSANSGEKQIECKRKFIIVGDYSCTIEGSSSANNPPVASSSARPGSIGTVPARYPQKLKTSASPAAPAAPAPSP